MVELLLGDIVARMALATFLGAIIGLERQLHGISAGMRTHALVCLGAAIFTVVSIQFSVLDPKLDIARVAAGVVTGVGFLGAGAIFFDKKGPHGFTTAANIWVVAAIGLMAGIGELITSVIATILILIVLFAGKLLETKVIKQKKIRF